MSFINLYKEPKIIESIYKKSDDYVQSPFRYPGGKYYALKFIIPFLNGIKHDEYWEPFVGGGSVFFGKKKAKFNWINDLEKNIIETYKTISQKDLCLKLIDDMTSEIANKDRHSFYKDLKPSNTYEVAKKTYYLNRTSYSGIINRPAWGYKIGNSSPPENWGRFLRNAQAKLMNTKITNKDFSEVINSKPEESNNVVLMYLDPPYYHADTKRAYTKPFLLQDHLRLEKELRKTKHYFCLSYDDCPEIRNLYKWAYIYERSWFYNTANTSGSRTMGKELIITNYNAKHDE